MDMSLVRTVKKSVHVLSGVLKLPTEEGQNLSFKRFFSAPCMV